MGPRYPRVLLVGLAEPPRPAPVVQRAANGHAAVAGAVRTGLCEARKLKMHFRVQLLKADKCAATSRSRREKAQKYDFSIIANLLY